MDFSTRKEKANLAERHKKSRQMNVATAMGIMGFNNRQWLDASHSGTDPKQELDKAQYDRMQELLKKKKLTKKEDSSCIQSLDASLTGYKKRTADGGVDKIQEDIMKVHEAYQFLMKEYRLNEKKIQAKTGKIVTTIGSESGLDSSDSGAHLDDINLNQDAEVGTETQE